MQNDPQLTMQDRIADVTRIVILNMIIAAVAYIFVHRMGAPTWASWSTATVVFAIDSSAHYVVTSLRDEIREKADKKR
jgi:hypothetical protein